eukprot:jgi/Mesvir1/23042/Mv08161-RA.1
MYGYSGGFLPRYQFRNGAVDSKHCCLWEVACRHADLKYTCSSRELRHCDKQPPFKRSDKCVACLQCRAPAHARAQEAAMWQRKATSSVPCAAYACKDARVAYISMRVAACLVREACFSTSQNGDYAVCQQLQYRCLLRRGPGETCRHVAQYWHVHDAQAGMCKVCHPRKSYLRALTLD